VSFGDVVFGVVSFWAMGWVFLVSLVSSSVLVRT